MNEYSDYSDYTQRILLRSVRFGRCELITRCIGFRTCVIINHSVTVRGLSRTYHPS